MKEERELPGDAGEPPREQRHAGEAEAGDARPEPLGRRRPGALVEVAQQRHGDRREPGHGDALEHPEAEHDREVVDGRDGEPGGAEQRHGGEDDPTPPEEVARHPDHRREQHRRERDRRHHEADPGVGDAQAARHRGERRRDGADAQRRGRRQQQDCVEPDVPA
ncbi:MAG: hypothetical protein U5J98_11035 [Halobacteriales archaeon]|nr:hypothetical protein [Halobacteriales archaeon]